MTKRRLGVVPSNSCVTVYTVPTGPRNGATTGVMNVAGKPLAQMNSLGGEVDSKKAPPVLEMRKLLVVTVPVKSGQLLNGNVTEARLPENDSVVADTGV